MSRPSTARPVAVGSHRRRTISRAQGVQRREAAASLRMRGRSTRGPTPASRAGSSVKQTSTLTSGMSRPPIPMLRSSATATTMSAKRILGTPLPPAGSDEQPVVDRDTEAYQGDEELHDEAHVGERRETKHDEERGEDRHRGDEQRHKGEERREHESEHSQRAQ